ncbi:DUF2304 domain-containing protein, partial [Cellulomonas sp. 179-A 9B4 NHS]|uniref:DUF2304 domain-containing protein n=1 Tax=Cellulomonas sp. 179-A 9B4 NHS TaxID=3142379 RepID=UPI00399F13AB
MISGYLFAVALCVLLVVLVTFLLRTRRMREKYAGVWITLAVAVAVVAAFPGLAFWLADVVGVEAPVNLLFAVGFLVLLVVVIQLSTEISSLEEETRTLAEEIALLRLEVTDLARATGGAPPAPGRVAQPAAPAAAP